jgi:hypothetical protein
MSPILEGLPTTHITDRLKKSEQIIRGLAAAIVGDHAGFRSVWEITNDTFDRWSAGSPKRVTSQEGEVIQQVA